jgi:hypothetical protein
MLYQTIHPAPARIQQRTGKAWALLYQSIQIAVIFHTHSCINSYSTPRPALLPAVQHQHGMGDASGSTGLRSVDVVALGTAWGNGASAADCTAAPIAGHHGHDAGSTRHSSTSGGTAQHGHDAGGTAPRPNYRDSGSFCTGSSLIRLWPALDTARPCTPLAHSSKVNHASGQ